MKVNSCIANIASTGSNFPELNRKFVIVRNQFLKKLILLLTSTLVLLFAGIVLILKNDKLCWLLLISAVVFCLFAVIQYVKFKMIKPLTTGLTPIEAIIQPDNYPKCVDLVEIVTDSGTGSFSY